MWCSRFPLKKYVRMTICLMSNGQRYENQCALEVSLNKTNFLLFFVSQFDILPTIGELTDIVIMLLT